VVSKFAKVVSKFAFQNGSTCGRYVKVKKAEEERNRGKAKAVAAERWDCTRRIIQLTHSL
jgi:hypothetical protein